MKKAVVVYFSKYGHTKRYAEFISEKLNCDIFKLQEVNEAKLLKYDLIIFGGPIKQDMIRGIDKFLFNIDDFEKQKFIFFSDGMLSFTPKVKERIYKSNFSDDILDKFSFYYLPGGFDLNKLDYGDTLIINYDVSKESELNYGDKYRMMRRLYKRKFDFVKEEHINSLISYAKEILSE